MSKAWIASPTATDPAQRIEVAGVNISRHGVCFSAATAIPDGAYYQIDVMMGTQMLKVEIQIIACRRNGDRYDVGAEFC